MQFLPLELFDQVDRQHSPKAPCPLGSNLPPHFWPQKSTLG